MKKVCIQNISKPNSTYQPQAFIPLTIDLSLPTDYSITMKLLKHDHVIGL
jgi:hypothetical protein